MPVPNDFTNDFTDYRNAYDRCDVECKDLRFKDQRIPDLNDCMERCIESSWPINGQGQQCCYNDDDDLILTGTGAGTPDINGTAAGEDEAGNCAWNPGHVFGHFCHDVIPWLILSDETYAEYWPPNIPSVPENMIYRCRGNILVSETTDKPVTILIE